MGSPPLARAPPGALLAMAVRPLALLGSLLVLMVAMPQTRVSGLDLYDPTRPRSDGDDDFVYKKCCLGNFCKTDTWKDVTDGCTVEVCDNCCSSSENPSYVPHYCNTQSRMALVAQILLGAALVVAVAALVSIILRTCSRDVRNRTQQRPQFRPSGNSSSSLDMYVSQRMHDCPPTYDEISWEKPPSYCNLQVLELPGSSAAGSEHREPPSPPYRSQLSEPASPGAGAAPPSYDGVFTISLQVHQMETEAALEDGQAAASAASKAEGPAASATAGQAQQMSEDSCSAPRSPSGLAHSPHSSVAPAKNTVNLAPTGHSGGVTSADETSVGKASTS